MKGFTLLEVMISLAIMAGVIMTTIVSFNYHLSIVARDKEEGTATILARAKIDDPAFAQLPAGKGTFAPDHPELGWEKALQPTQLSGVDKMIFTVSWDQDKKKVALVRYIDKTF